MDSILQDPNVQAAFYAFLGALAALALPKIFGWLKGLAAKTSTDIDDKIVDFIEEKIEELIKKKLPAPDPKKPV